MVLFVLGIVSEYKKDYTNKYEEVLYGKFTYISGTLIELLSETPWCEFKHNNFEPDMIGMDISALANSAAYCDRDKAYMIWGIDDITHEIVGTEYNRFSKLKGNQEIENWLRSLLSSNCEFEFHDVNMNNKMVVVLIIYRATYQTVTFKKVDYIRVGRYTKKLMDTPSMQAKLWDNIRNTKFEDIYAKKLSDFKSLSRKAVRIIQYEGNNKANILKEFTSNRGYVVEFEGVINFLEALLPSREEINGATRKTKTAYPMIALREIIANALIHQDFSVTGSGITIEVFDKRIEVTNPGIPLIDVRRIVDNPPKSRNEKLASLMRNLKMCEELGCSNITKFVLM